ncbi:hypothetical protein OEZ86_001563 [Tetradesmus obliquus]|nr:hypothetical protein OEZ86_001563 [Tetradesmus obliquus]
MPLASIGSPSPILKFAPKAGHKMIIRRHENVSDKIWRNRGVLLVTSIPLLVIMAMIFFFFPASKPVRDLKAMTIGQLHHQQQPAAAAGGGAYLYNIVLDAGSTGSRIHIFKFEQKGSSLNLISDGFHQLKPGLSAFPDEPQKAADSLKPLLEEAMKAVPAAQQASTGLSLKATAGLRLLPGSKADDILAAVRKFLATYPFKLKTDAVEVMDGAHEGAFAWLTLNYLLGRLGSGPTGTVAAIDLGGGSVQEAFALPSTEATAAPAGYITQLKAGGVTYDVYVHSYLGYGLMAARAKVIEAGRDDPSHPCFAKGSSLKYSYAGKEYSIGETIEAGDFKRCAAMALKALDHDKDCGQPKDACSFSGAWRGKPATMARVYYVSSYFWDRASESSIIADKAAIEWKTSPGDFAKRAAAVCGKAVPELTKSYSDLLAANAPYFCLDLSFCHTVLTQGFDLAETASVTLVKQVKYNGQTIEAAWPLGAAINDLSS